MYKEGRSDSRKASYLYSLDSLVSGSCRVPFVIHLYSHRNNLLAKVVDRAFCLIKQDNYIVLAMNTVYITNNINNFQDRQRRRPAKTFTIDRIVRKVFKDNLI
jgi:hypothetical protein